MRDDLTNNSDSFALDDALKELEKDEFCGGFPQSFRQLLKVVSSFEEGYPKDVKESEENKEKYSRRFNEFLQFLYNKYKRNTELKQKFKELMSRINEKKVQLTKSFSALKNANICPGGAPCEYFLYKVARKKDENVKNRQSITLLQFNFLADYINVDETNDIPDEHFAKKGIPWFPEFRQEVRHWKACHSVKKKLYEKTVTKMGHLHMNEWNRLKLEAGERGEKKPEFEKVIISPNIEEFRSIRKDFMPFEWRKKALIHLIRKNPDRMKTFENLKVVNEGDDTRALIALNAVVDASELVDAYCRCPNSNCNRRDQLRRHWNQCGLKNLQRLKIPEADRPPPFPCQYDFCQHVAKKGRELYKKYKAILDEWNLKKAEIRSKRKRSLDEMMNPTNFDSLSDNEKCQKIDKEEIEASKLISIGEYDALISSGVAIENERDTLGLVTEAPLSLCMEEVKKNAADVTKLFPTDIISKILDAQTLKCNLKVQDRPRVLEIIRQAAKRYLVETTEGALKFSNSRCFGNSGSKLQLKGNDVISHLSRHRCALDENFFEDISFPDYN
eukprot:g1333.t1